ncbi:DNA-protecting protein DprA [Candidatus Woesearchaeota archaeon]|nr:DNA-protecting protein DprA [Candidatus Woesearchaeota archaeon]
MEEEKVYLNALNVATDNDYPLIVACREFSGTYKRAWEFFVGLKGNIRDIRATLNLPKERSTDERVAELRVFTQKIDPYAEYTRLEWQGVVLLLPEDEGYLLSLSDLPQPPLGLYVRGDMSSVLKQDKALAVVGTRMCTPYGKVVCERIIPDVARNGVAIVSGLALGIDAIAHSLTVRNQGVTVAVLGSGLGRLYPPQNKRLSGEILDSGGALVSEYHLFTEPLRFNFPRRNRIVAALSRATLVVEAPEKSGSLITATCALEMGRDVFAVPGAINSENSFGTNKLIKDGALIATSSEDVLQYFGLHTQLDKSRIELDDQEMEVIKILDRNGGSMHTDALCVEFSDKEITHVISLLTQLELKDAVKVEGTRVIKK